MAQASSPNADTQVGSWTTVPLYSKIDETSPDDSDYISHTSGAFPCILGLSTITAPNLTRGMVYLQVRVRETGSPVSPLTVTLYSDVTTVFTWTLSPPSDFYTFVRALTPTELALFTDWSLNSVSFHHPGPGTVDVSYAALIDQGTMDRGAEPIDDQDMLSGGYCGVTGMWFPASELMTVDGRRVWVKTRKEPRRDREL